MSVQAYIVLHCFPWFKVQASQILDPLLLLELPIHLEASSTPGLVNGGRTIGITCLPVSLFTPGDILVVQEPVLFVCT